jgi:3',5'-cyclic AMP phosphodiesterase CpdA
MRIALISDTHLAERAAVCISNWRVVRTWIERARPDLVVHLGDITVDGASDSAELREAVHAFAQLDVPIRFLPGNHDIGDNPIAPDVRPEHPLDLARLEEYRTLFGPDRWSLHAGDWQLIGLNAQLLGTATSEEEQLFAWLEHELRLGTGPLGLMLHKPLFRHGPGDDERHIRYVPKAARDRLLGVLRSRALRFVVSGHAHQSRWHMCGGVEHRWAPSTAFCLPDGMQERIGEKEVGLLMLMLDGTDHRFVVARPAGLRRNNILDHPELYPGIAELRAALVVSALL